MNKNRKEIGVEGHSKFGLFLLSGILIFIRMNDKIIKLT